MVYEQCREQFSAITHAQYPGTHMCFRKAHLPVPNPPHPTPPASRLSSPGLYGRSMSNSDNSTMKLSMENGSFEIFLPIV